MDRVVDLHCDTVAEIQAGADIISGHPAGHIDLNRLKKGMVGGQVFAVYISSAMPEENAFSECKKLLEIINDLCLDHQSYFQKVWSAGDLEKTMAQGRVAVFPAVENGYAIENKLSNLEKLRSFGIRYMTLTHARNLKWAASSGEEKGNIEGLTVFGKKVIAAMNEMGIIVDLSHVHETTFWAALKESKRPPIASHSDAAALCATPRNLTDDQIKAIADKGGMIGINFFPGFLDKKYLTEQTKRCGDLFDRFGRIERDYWQEPRERAQGMHRLGDELVDRMADIEVGSEAVLRHFRYIIDLVGDDYVGFGSDFDGLPALPYGMSGCDVFPQLIDRMRSEGFSSETIDKISRDNFIRVLKAHP